MPPDRLPADDRRVLSVPVLAGIPVVFVDQLGEEEDPAKGRYGETFRLRRLLAPVTARGGESRQLVQVRHKQVGQLDRALVEDARLVILAGVERPGPSVHLLRDYVLQGGQLVIAAGADFDPAAWTADAWLDGAGILPAPLRPEALGKLPEESPRDLQPFSLAFESLAHDYFIVGSGTRDELEDLYRLPFFFKAVAADLSDATLAVAAEAARRAPDGAGPSWLLWRANDGRRSSARSRGARASGAPASSRATRTERPFSSSAGSAAVMLFISTGLYSSWSTITRTNAVLIFDRMFRAMIERTLPRRNLDPVESFVLPITPAERRAMFTLERPGGGNEPLGVDALGPNAYGVTLRGLVERGHYTVTARRTLDGGGASRSASPARGERPERESELKATMPGLEAGWARRPVRSRAATRRCSMDCRRAGFWKYRARRRLPPRDGASRGGNRVEEPRRAMHLGAAGRSGAGRRAVRERGHPRSPYQAHAPGLGLFGCPPARPRSTGRQRRARPRLRLTLPRAARSCSACSDRPRRAGADGPARFEPEAAPVAPLRRTDSMAIEERSAGAGDGVLERAVGGSAACGRGQRGPSRSRIAWVQALDRKQEACSSGLEKFRLRAFPFGSPKAREPDWSPAGPATPVERRRETAHDVGPSPLGAATRTARRRKSRGASRASSSSATSARPGPPPSPRRKAGSARLHCRRGRAVALDLAVDFRRRSS
jgi:hypothetical protein